MFNINTKLVPTTPGIYFFRDKRGRILYIGKAVNLKNRLASYFKSQLGGRTAKLVEESAKVTWQETGSEIEAIILESQLIKKHKPPFNIMLRDDKQYFYVVFTQEQFPKVFTTHQPIRKVTGYRLQVTGKENKNKNSPLKPDTWNLTPDFIGPFTDGSALKTVLKLLRRIFPYCTCKQKHNNFCLNYHIGKCGGLCCLNQQSPNFQFPPKESLRDPTGQAISNFQKEYKKNTRAIKEILSGKRVSLIKKLKKEMVDLGRAGKFEEAIELRDKIEKLKKIFENAQIVRNTNLQIRANATNNEKVADGLKKLLKLPNLPRRIEGYDISNIQGKFATGAMVVVTNGQPDKNQYRKFKIRSWDQIDRLRKSTNQRIAMMLNQKPNDIAMLQEILTRRFNHPEWPWPDLIIIDGGKAQLNVAVKVISAQIYAHRKSIDFAMTKNSIPIIALTKNKRHRGSHIYLGSSQDPRLKNAVIPLKKLPEQVKNLILQVDAEAHRFAIRYYRKLHKMSVQENTLS